jgi:hypothetical protein
VCFDGSAKFSIIHVDSCCLRHVLAVGLRCWHRIVFDHPTTILAAEVSVPSRSCPALQHVWISVQHRATEMRPGCGACANKVSNKMATQGQKINRHNPEFRRSFRNVIDISQNYKPR